LTDIVICMSSK